MACCAACGAFYVWDDGISDIQASKTIQLFLKGKLKQTDVERSVTDREPSRCG